MRWKLRTPQIVSSEIMPGFLTTSISGDGSRSATGISSEAEASSSGDAGTIFIQAQTILLHDGAVVTTKNDNIGVGGPISISVRDTFEIDRSSVRTETASGNGGNVTLTAGRLFDQHGKSTVTTSAAGGKGSGGNIEIDAPLMVLDSSQIIADAFGGPGGKITIRAGQFIRTPDSVIHASSAQNVSGIITITAPNTDVAGSLVILPETFLNASSQLREACAARGGRRANSFKPGGRGGLPPDPGTPLVASPFGQSPRQQTATGLPTTSTARPQQAAKPITVSGIPQPVLGAPRLTCRG